MFLCGITHLEIQIFARKLVRPFGSVSNEDVLNEAHAIDLLQSQGTSENIIKVFRHGWLPGSMYYYIDMELCQLTLEDCLERRGPTSGLYLASRNPRLFGPILTVRETCHTWDIITNLGRNRIRTCLQVHRDLKARNGNYPEIKVNTVRIIFGGVQNVENWRLRLAHL